MASDLSYLKAGYKKEKWKWLFELHVDTRQNLLSDVSLVKEAIKSKDLLKIYDFDKYPKLMPCPKKCSNVPWCLTDVTVNGKSKKESLTKQLRDMSIPVGLQNTANTCWINSALQSLFQIKYFRNCIHSINGFAGEESLNKFIYLLQAMFVEMELHKNRALECSSGSVFEKLAVFATKKVMQKDQDHEDLKCVSEFLENTIDFLLGDPNTGSIFSPLFQTSLCRIARWKCTSCGRNHAKQLPPVTSYIIGAYVSSDECPLQQCLLDLQTETQTGVLLKCGQIEGVDGCGAAVKVDRVVTPRILSLPSILIIRNNSLVDTESRKRFHVVYPETLDLSMYTINSNAMTYSLRAVIYHHGYWVKHFSAHVKTEDGRWFNFNDEKVSPLVPHSGTNPPPEVNKNYFSLNTIAGKYKGNKNVRVSRGAFIWIYERNSGEVQRPIQPSIEVLNYVLNSQGNGQKVQDATFLKTMKQKRKTLFQNLSMTSVNDNFRMISRFLLIDWLASNDLIYEAPPSILARGICQHKKLDPFESKSMKCISADKCETLLNEDFGIHSTQSSLPIIYTLEDIMCKECVSKDAHHILFRENLREFVKIVKKEASKTEQSGYKPVGQITFKSWQLGALSSYLKDKEIHEEVESSPDPTDEEGGSSTKQNCEDSDPSEDDTKVMEVDKESESQNVNGKTESQDGKDIVKNEANDGETANFNNNIKSPQLFNHEIVCPHNQFNPKVPVLWVPNATMEKLEEYCKDFLHPAFEQNYDPCSICQASISEIQTLCDLGKVERKQLCNVYSGRKRPVFSKLSNPKFYLCDREFISEWRSYVKLSEIENYDLVRPQLIDNEDIVCKHNQVKYYPSKYGPLFDDKVFLHEDEWNILKEKYIVTHTVEVFFNENGMLETTLGTCPLGCVEEQAKANYEEQFNYEWGWIHIRQINSEADLPVVASDQSNSPHKLDDLEKTPRKRQKINPGENWECRAAKRAANLKLVRASKQFACDDTIKEVQNFIAEKTGIWPILQTMWLRGNAETGNKPLLLTDDHRNMTLRSLRVKEDDTIYFKAAMEDLEKAAGDGISEYEEDFEFAE